LTFRQKQYCTFLRKVSKRKVIYDLVDRFGDVFAKDWYDVGTVKESDYKACIELTEHKYVAKRPYHCSIKD